jgi:DNA-binding transcriptional LysR family regulator
MNLHHLELFYYVCRHGGISRAVRNMPYGIQQPAVSSQILALEEDLGTKLFERQPFRLTPPGQELYDFARPFFDNAEPVAERLRNQSGPKLRIASSELILRDYLPHVLSDMRKRHPKLRFSLRSGLQSEVESWLLAGETDMGITTLDSSPKPNLGYLSITKIPMVLLVLKSSGIKTASELWAKHPVAEPLICLPPEESSARCFQAGLKRLKVEWPTAIEASSLGLVTRYVANGYGVGVTLDLPDLTQHPKIRALPLPGFGPIEIAAMWKPPLSALQTDLQKAIATRARQLWP